MRAYALAATILVALAARPVVADNPSADTTDLRNYRLQLLGADALGYGLVVVGVAEKGEAVDHDATLDGLAMVEFGSPFVHVLHGEWGRFGGSLGLRAGLSGLGFMLGAAVASNCDGCRNRAANEGLLLGLVTASILDAALQTRIPTRGRPAAWSPQITPRHGGGTIGVAGAF
jgi:hypothetical protein